MAVDGNPEWVAVGKRLRAARFAAGYDKRKDFTDVLNLPRFKHQTLGLVERGRRELYEHEADAIAKVLPVSADSLLHGDAPAGGLQGQLAEMQQAIAQQNQNLFTQTQVLESIIEKQTEISAALVDLPIVAEALAVFLQRLEAGGLPERREDVGG